VKFNVGQLCVDVKCKHTASILDGMKCAGSKLSSVERKLQNKNVQTTRQSNTAHILSQYIYFIPSSIICPYKLYTYTEGCCWNRPVFKTDSGSSVETQVSAEAGGTVDTQGMKIQQ